MTSAKSRMLLKGNYRVIRQIELNLEACAQIIKIYRKDTKYKDIDIFTYIDQLINY